MTFKEFVFQNAMQKISFDTALRYVGQIVGEDLAFEAHQVRNIFFSWFFEITQETINCWNGLVQTNNAEGAEALIVNFQDALRSRIIPALGNHAMYLEEETQEWLDLITSIYIEVFADYINSVMPTFIPHVKMFLQNDELDEGIDDF